MDEAMQNNPKTIVVVGGPNGAGKATLKNASAILRDGKLIDAAVARATADAARKAARRKASRRRKAA